MLTLLLALSQPAANLSPQPEFAPVAPPSAIPLPPPVEERLPGFDGRPTRTLVYTLPETLADRRTDGYRRTIAFQRWVGARIAEIPAAERTATFLCTIGDNGLISPIAPCSVETASPHAAQLNRLGFLLRPPIDAGPAPASGRNGRGLPLPRALRFTLRLDPANWPEPWAPSAAPSVAGGASHPLYTMMQRRWTDRYPPAALRAGASALVMADCGVEADRSISCRTASITPPASEPYFRDVIEREIPSGLAPATLSDGRATPGLEFRVPIRFMIGT